MGWRNQSAKAKTLHRPSLKDWAHHNHYDSFHTFASPIFSNPSEYIRRRTIPPSDDDYRPCLPVYLDARTLSPSEFHERYETPGIPSVITHIPQGYPTTLPTNMSDSNLNRQGQGVIPTKNKPWPALQNWNISSLQSDTIIRNRHFKCGEDDDGNNVKLKLKHFLKYTCHTHDDSPLYIFDSQCFDSPTLSKRILKDYVVPPYFHEDLFHLVGEKHRPPYRWFLIGPARSGTSVHIDPLGTSAWNTSLIGTKLWVIFPPNVPKRVVKGHHLLQRGEDDEPIDYFINILPRIRNEYRNSHMSSNPQSGYENFECYEFIQHATETVFVPNGWWHAVLNLTHTVAITQNFCSRRNFETVWQKTRVGRKKMARRWLGKLDVYYPQLAKLARELNIRDRFLMKYGHDPRKKKTNMNSHIHISSFSVYRWNDEYGRKEEENLILSKNRDKSRISSRNMGGKTKKRRKKNDEK